MSSPRPLLQVIIGSTRPGRVGPAIAQWFTERAETHGAFEIEVVDLAEVNLPLFNEPNHPVTRQYTFDYTRQWSETINRADAYVFVIPEYNHSLNAATKNAIDYLHHEWRFKPAGIVCYGGGAMGTRAAQHLKPVLAALRVVHAGDVAIPLQTTPVIDGVFRSNDVLDHAAASVLTEIAALHPGLHELRTSRSH